MNGTRLLEPGDNTMIYKGYTAGIEYSAADDCLVGHILGIRDVVTFHGNSVKEIRAAFGESIEFYLMTCAEADREPNKPFSLKILNALTRETIEKVDRGEDLHHAKDTDDLFKQLAED